MISNIVEDENIIFAEKWTSIAFKYSFLWRKRLRIDLMKLPLNIRLEYISFTSS